MRIFEIKRMENQKRKESNMDTTQKTKSYEAGITYSSGKSLKKNQKFFKKLPIGRVYQKRKSKIKEIRKNIAHENTFIIENWSDSFWQ